MLISLLNSVYMIENTVWYKMNANKSVWAWLERIQIRPSASLWVLKGKITARKRVASILIPTAHHAYQSVKYYSLFKYIIEYVHACKLTFYFKEKHCTTVAMKISSWISQLTCIIKVTYNWHAGSIVSLGAKI